MLAAELNAEVSCLGQSCNALSEADAQSNRHLSSSVQLCIAILHSSTLHGKSWLLCQGSRLVLCVCSSSVLVNFIYSM